MRYESKIIERLTQSGCCKRMHFKKGECIIFQGKKNHKLYLLNQADLTVIYHATSGRRYTIAQEKNFSGILGELEIFRSEARSTFSVMLDMHLSCYFIDKANLMHLLQNNAELAIDFIQLISERYENNIIHSIRVILYSLQYNLIQLLLKKQNLFPDQFFPLSVTNESAMLGASSRSIRRILKSFIDESLIIKKDRQYKIVDMAGLKKLLLNEQNINSSPS